MKSCVLYVILYSKDVCYLQLWVFDHNYDAWFNQFFMCINKMYYYIISSIMYDVFGMLGCIYSLLIDVLIEFFDVVFAVPLVQ
jgi:hypothetical protein